MFHSRLLSQIWVCHIYNFFVIENALAVKSFPASLSTSIRLQYKISPCTSAYASVCMLVCARVCVCVPCECVRMWLCVFALWMVNFVFTFQTEVRRGGTVAVIEKPAFLLSGQQSKFPWEISCFLFDTTVHRDYLLNPKYDSIFFWITDCGKLTANSEIWNAQNIFTVPPFSCGFSHSRRLGIATISCAYILLRRDTQIGYGSRLWHDTTGFMNKKPCGEFRMHLVQPWSNGGSKCLVTECECVYPLVQIPSR